MRFSLDAEQEQLRDVARQLLPSATWPQLAELGLTGLLVPADLGGSGATVVEAAVVLREAGRALSGLPLLTCTLAGAVLGADQDKQRRALAAGDVVATLAVDDLSGAEVLATRHGPEWGLTGTKQVVLHGAEADLLLVVADVEGMPALFLVETGSPGVQAIPAEALDPTRSLATVVLDDAKAVLLEADLEQTMELAAVLLAAEQVGGAEQCLHEAVAYAKTRVQFGRPIGSFQAVKHLLADALLDLECARSAADYAAWAAACSPAELPLMSGVAKAVCSDAYVSLASLHLQVHGGMGFTWEHTSHLHLKRAMTANQLFGSPDFHREHLAALGLAGD